MRGEEIVKWLCSFAFRQEYERTCDNFKNGNADIDVKRLGVAMFATPRVIREAQEWGAELLIVHEPLYYNHHDAHSEDKIECEKRELLERSGIAVYRFHDHPHYTRPDMIAEGELKYMGLEGDVEYTGSFDLVRIRLKEKMTPRELASLIEKRLNIKHVRIAGSANVKMSNISCMFGAPGGMLDELKTDGCEMLIGGEVCEWALCEYARDAAELGHGKAVLTLGHVGSERDGMRYIAELLRGHFSDIDVRYFECGEVYSYSE